MRHIGRMVAAMAFMVMTIPVHAEAQGWRERVIAAVRPGAVVARRGLGPGLLLVVDRPARAGICSIAVNGVASR